MSCRHENFVANVTVNRLGPEDGPMDFNADVRIKCSGCNLDFKFLGLERGLNFDGAAMSYDQTEAHLAISPDGQPTMGGDPRGFRISGPGI